MLKMKPRNLMLSGLAALVLSATSCSPERPFEKEQSYRCRVTGIPVVVEYIDIGPKDSELASFISVILRSEGDSTYSHFMQGTTIDINDKKILTEATALLNYARSKGLEVSIDAKTNETILPSKEIASGNTLWGNPSYELRFRKGTPYYEKLNDVGKLTIRFENDIGDQDLLTIDLHDNRIYGQSFRIKEE